MSAWFPTVTVWSRKKRRVPKAKSGVALAYAKHKPAARAVISADAARYADIYGFTYQRIAIRNTRRNWGSCSALGNLNFSYKLMFLPPCLRHYIIVHELCHLRELNHSANFWAEVASIMPDYDTRRRTLRAIETSVGTSLAALEKVTRTHDVTCHHCDADRNLTAAVKEIHHPSVVIDETLSIVAIDAVLEV